MWRGRCGHRFCSLAVHLDDAADNLLGLELFARLPSLHILRVHVPRIDDPANVDVGDFTLIVGKMQFDFFQGAILRLWQQIIDGNEAVE